MTTPTPPAEVFNPQAEALLRELDLVFELRFVPYADIDHQASLANQARIEPLTEERVERYLSSKESGATFPAVLCGRNGRGKLHTADGNHRNESGIRSGEDGTWAYVFTYSNIDEFRAVADLANVRLNGAENTQEERLMHAAQRVDNGLTVTEAARIFGVTKSGLTNYRQAQTARARFSSLGIASRSFAGISDTVLAQINGTVADEAVRDVLAAIREGLPTREIIAECRTAKGPNEHARAEAQRTALLELRERQKKTSASRLLEGPRKRRDTTRMRLLGAVKVIKEALADPTPEYENIIAQIRRLVARP